MWLVTRRWQPWTIAFLGVAIFSLTLADLILATGPIGPSLFQASIPMLWAAVVVGFGIWLRTTDFDDEERTLIAAWTLGSTVGFGVLGGWAFLVMRDADIPATDAGFIVLAAVAFGGVVGGLVGVYDARQGRQREHAENARAALDATNDGVATFDADGRFTMVNDAFVRMYGYDDPDELLGEPWKSTVAEDATERIESTVTEAVLETGAWRGEVAATRQDGTTFPVEMSVSGVDGNGTVLVVRDVTERLERVEELRYRTSLLEAQFDANRDGILILDDDWEVISYNDRFAELWDLPDGAGESGGFDVVEAMEGRLASPAALRERVEYLKRNPSESDSATVQARDGRILDRYSAPITDEGTNYGRVLTFRDVTDEHRRDRMVEALHQASHQLAYADTKDAVATVAVDVARQVFEKPVSCLWLFDEDDGTLQPSTLSPAAEERFRAAGHDEPPNLGQGTPEMGSFRSGEIAVVDADDEYQGDALSGLDLGSLVTVPLADHGVLGLGDPETEGPSGAEHQLVGILQQHVIAALDRVERARELTEREQSLRTIVENVPIVLFAFDREGVFTLSEGVGLEGIGLEPGEAVGDPVEDVFAAAPRIVELCRRALAGEAVAETVELAGRTFEAWLDPVADAGEVDQVIGTAVDVSARARYERSIEALHAATRKMMGAEDPATVGEVVTDVAREVLSLPVSGVWLADAGGDRLEPASLTPAGRDLLGSPPTFEGDEGIAWRAYETGETLVFDDVRREPDANDPETLVRSQLIVPMGRYGVLVSGSTAPGDFDENDVALAELLAGNAEAAIERTERERRLERQTAQFEFFNSILRHDVLNGMTVIRSRGVFLAERLEGEEAGFASTIVEWADDITEVVGRVRRVLETLTTDDQASLAPVNVSETIDERVGRIEATYPAVELAADVPDDLFVVADELLADVLGNVLTNAVEHNGPEGLRLGVTAAREGGDVVVRIADNGTGVEDDRKEAVFRRGETGHVKATGSGFGLFFVDAMVDRYGGEVWVEDNDVGGATFVVRITAADADEIE